MLAILVILPSLLSVPCRTVDRTTSAYRYSEPQKPGDKSREGTNGSTGVSSADRVKRDIQLDSLVAAANSAPPEFAADALIRLVESPQSLGSSSRKDLLERAFVLSGEAQQPVRRKITPLPGYPVDTSAGYVSYAFEHRLDALSLRIRVINLMLKLDRQRARELFDQIPAKLPLPPVSCEDAMVYDVSEYYDLLGELVRTGFSEKERQQAIPTRLVERYVGAITSASQIVPAIKLILSVNAGTAELNLLSQALIGAIAAIPPDDRSFTHAVAPPDLTTEVFRLQRELEQKHVYPGKGLLRAYREYLLSNLRGSRCAENAPAEKAAAPLYVRQANEALFSGSPLTVDEVKPKQVLEKAKVYEYWKTAEAERLLERLRDLRFGPTNLAYNAETVQSSLESDTADADDREGEPAVNKESVGWQLKFSQFLSDLELWKGSGERSPLDCFQQKQVLYQGLVDIAPSRLRAPALRSWVNSLNDKSIQSENRIEWYLHVHYLIAATKTLSAETRDAILEEMVNSNNAALSLYGRLERLESNGPR